jgi:hypothetical protein
MAESYPNICSVPKLSVAFQNALLIKKRFQLNNIPPIRYDNLVNNPYNNNYTQSQLDMRRKAEILQYTANNTNTKTNSLTKKELWAQLAKGSTQKRSLSSSFIQSNTITTTPTSIFIQTCPSGTILQTPTYASDVPGPIISLFLDPVIPLYNYTKNQDAYGIINKALNPFTYDTSTNQILTFIDNIPQNSVVLTSIYIENLNMMSYSFTITLPISIYVKGRVRMNITNNKIPYVTSTDYKNALKNPIITNMNVTANNKSEPFALGVKYSNKDLTITYDINSLNIINNAIFDISMIPNYNDPSNNYFYGNQYVGTITFSNFKAKYNNYIQNGFDTQYGYIYNILLNTINTSKINYLYSYTNNPNYTKYFSTLESGYYANVTKDNMNKFVNCSVRNPVIYSKLKYQPLTIT